MSYRKQLVVGAAANLGNIASGMTLGFSAVALPTMQAVHHTPQVSDEQASWIASTASLGMTAGCLVLSPLLDGLGRRRTLMLVNMPALLGWLLIAMASHSKPWFFYQLYIGRLLTGLAVSLIATSAVVYVGEVLDKTWRVVVVTWPSLGISLGIFMVYVLGSLLQDNWRLVAGICSFFPAVSIAAVWFLLPESPVWLLSRGNVQEAEASMRYTRNVTRGESLPDNLQQELDAMMLSSTRLDSSSNWKDKLSFLKRPEAYKPLLIINVFFFFQQASGIFVVISYTVTIVMETGVQVDSYLVTVLIGVSRIVMSIVISYASKRYGRRLLCNISGAGMALSVGVLALFLCLMHNDVIGLETAAAYGWVPITALLLSVLTGSLGFLPLPFAMLGEIFPAKIRGWACSFSTFMANIYCFLVVKIFPMMRNLMGFHNVFTFYAAAIAIGTIIMYFWLPETRGKTLKEIEEFFRSGGKAAVRDKAREIMMPELAELENTSVENGRLSMRGCRDTNADKATEKLISGPQCPEELIISKN